MRLSDRAWATYTAEEREAKNRVDVLLDSFCLDSSLPLTKNAAFAYWFSKSARSVCDYVSVYIYSRNAGQEMAFSNTNGLRAASACKILVIFVKTIGFKR